MKAREMLKFSGFCFSKRRGDFKSPLRLEKKPFNCD